MRHSYTWDQWENPCADMDEGYHRVSYVLFRSDGGEARILTGRCPDVQGMRSGESLIRAAGLCEEARTYLTRGDEVPLWVRTKWGVGLLDRRYERHTGIGILWHIHGNPEALACMICENMGCGSEMAHWGISRRIREDADACKQCDEISYGAFAEACRVFAGIEIGRSVPIGTDGSVYGDDLLALVRDMAGFAGCALSVEDARNSAIRRVRCYSLPLLESLLLYLLTEARNESATRDAVVRMSAAGDEDGGNLILEIRYPVEKSGHTATARGGSWDDNHRYITVVSEFGGAAFFTEICPLSRRDPLHRELAEARITLEWLTDPALLPTTDLKAFLQLQESKGNEGDAKGKLLERSFPLDTLQEL